MNTFSNGWKFSDEKVITELKKIGNKEFPEIANSKSCTDFYLHTIYFQCHYEIENQETKGWNCWITDYTVKYLYTICDDVIAGGSGGYQSNTPNTDFIYGSGSTLNSSQKLLLKNAKTGFKTRNLFYSIIWQYLISL
ncbi:MAG TPA: hypothetical protein PL101_11845 [Bacteroidales bacterium]|nr:hypothetical protein [Bacteroidales bacterium]HQK71792.1 hypothetical protein [Bacteroidales bacterium]